MMNFTQLSREQHQSKHLSQDQFLLMIVIDTQSLLLIGQINIRPL